MKPTADILGYIVALLCLIGTQFPERWQMLVNQIIVNTLAGISVFMITGISSAGILNFVAVIHILFSLEHCVKNKKVSITKTIIFTITYLLCGIFGFKEELDILPIAASMLFMCNVISKKEQRMRLFSLANVIIYIIYYIIIGSTLVYAQIFSLISVLIALFRYRKK